MIFFQGGDQGVLSLRAQGNIIGVDFVSKKFPNFDQIFKFSLNLTKLRLNPVKLVLIFEFRQKNCNGRGGNIFPKSLEGGGSKKLTGLAQGSWL